MILENQKTNQIDFPHYKEHFIIMINNGDLKMLSRQKIKNRLKISKFFHLKMLFSQK